MSPPKNTNTDEPTKRLAVLIDADNAQAAVIEALLEEVARFGEATVRRIYGDFTSPTSSSWKKLLNKHSIKPIQQFAYTTGKNATDSTMIIDAMDLLYTRRFDGFCLVTSDSDFTGLAAASPLSRASLTPPASAGRLPRTLGRMKTIRATRCVLEPQVEAHSAAMFEVLSDPAIYEFEGVSPPSLEKLAAGYRRKESRLSPDGREKWLNWVVRLPNNELAGYVQATLMESGASLVGYEFASKYWRQGIGSASIKAMLDELAQSYAVHTFVAVLKRANYRSMALLHHLGFEPGTAEDARTYQAEEDETVLLKAAEGLPSTPTAQRSACGLTIRST